MIRAARILIGADNVRSADAPRIGQNRRWRIERFDRAAGRPHETVDRKVAVPIGPRGRPLLV